MPVPTTPPLLADPGVRAMVESLLAGDSEHALVLLDDAGTIVAWLGAARRLFGYEAGEIVGRHVRELFMPHDRAVAQAETEIDAARRVGRAEDDRWHLRGDGGAIFVSGTVTALHDRDGRPIGFAKIMRDRTDLRTQVETLETRLAGLSDRLEAASTLFATLGHELRNPLAPMLQVAAVLEKSEGAPGVDVSAGILRRQIAVLQRLAGDLMDFARLETGRLPLQLTTFALQELLEDIVRSHASIAAQRELRFELLLPPAPIMVRADRERLQQVIVNLVDNAMRHNGPGQRIVVRAIEEPPDAVVRVDDDGAGIAPDLLPHLFELFARGSSTPVARQGLGIGLALAKELVELHGGTIEARSAGVGLGASFAVRIPTRVASAGA